MKILLKQFSSLLIIILFQFCQKVSAQDPEIKATAPSTVAVGQAFNYTISGDFDGKVSLPEMDGIRIAGGPSTYISQQVTNVNGKFQTVKEVTYSYTFVAEKEGDLTIPPAKVTSGRKEYYTNEIKIKAFKGAQQAIAEPGQSEESIQEKNESIFARLIPTRRTLYLGEQFVLSSKIFTQEPLQIADIKAPALEGFWKEELKADESSSRETYNGDNYLTLVFNRYLLTAQKPGEIKIHPVEVNCLVQKRVKSERPRSFFNDPFFNDPFFNDSFFDRVQTVKEVISSNALTMVVKPLPPNAPSGFNGAVGNFTLRAGIDKDQLRVNDALTFKITLNGHGNLALIKPVKVDFPPDLEVFEPKSIPDLKNTVDGTSGTLTFEYVVIPRHAGKFRISPVIFSYFDPVGEKYQNIQTKEFNFSVEKSEEQDESFITSPGIMSPKGRNEGIKGQSVQSLADDIRFIILSEPLLSKTGVRLFGSRIFILTYLAVILIFIGLVIFKREKIRRNADINAVRNRKARRIAQKRLSVAYDLMQTGNEKFYEEILKALWGYLSDKLGINVSELSREHIDGRLQALPIPEELLKDLWQTIDDCELARYGTGYSGDKQLIYKKAIRLISDLQEKLN